MPSVYYKRRLPHWQPEYAALFVTWRLHGSLAHVPGLLLGPNPGKAFVALDREWGQASSGPRWLADERVAQCVADVLHHAADQLHLYDLHAWVIMSNHVHILIQPHATLPRIMTTVKGFSARQANEILGRAGEPFWFEEYFDRWIRDSTEHGRIADYIESNPVTAGLVESPQDYRWSSAWAGLEPRPTGAHL